MKDVNIDEMFLDGAIGHDDPRDYTAGDLGEDLRSIFIPRLNDPKSTVNQAEHTETKLSCTIAGSYRQVAQLNDDEATTNELLEIVEWCNKNCGYDYQGQLSSAGASMMAKQWNAAHPEDKILFIKLTYDDPDTEWLQKEKNFLLGCTYRGNGKYNKDFKPDNVLDGVSFGAHTYGHRTCTLNGYIYDTYHGRSYNKYKLGRNHNTFNELVENKVYYPTLYLFLKESRLNKKSLKQIKEEQKEKRYAIIYCNALSIFFPHLNEEEQRHAAEKAKKYREKYDIPKYEDNKMKILAILSESIKDVLSDVTDAEKSKVLDIIEKLFTK